MDLENVSKRKLKKELGKMYMLLFRVAGELYCVNPGSKIFTDSTFNRENMDKISKVATELQRQASGWDSEDGKPN